ncbi:MAG: diguanylate cyclase, partial [Pseudomonadota bacterium]
MPKDEVFNLAASQNGYGELIAEHGSDAIVVTDRDGRVEWVNPAFRQLSGFTLEEMKGRKPGDVLQGPKTDPETVAAISEALKKRRPIRTEILNYMKSGEDYWIEINITPIFDESGRHTHFMSIERDITDRKRYEEESRSTRTYEESRRRERRLVSLANEWLHATKSIDELLRVVHKCMQALVPESDGALFLYNNSRDVLEVACQWGTLEQPDFIEPDDCWALRRGRLYTYGIDEIEFACAHTDETKTEAYLCIPIVAHGDTIGLLHLSFPPGTRGQMSKEAFISWITSRRELAIICAEQISLAIANARLRRQLEDQSVRDLLTGLWNRRWFLDVARKEINKARSDGSNLCLISLDVDFFKKLNDRYGHDAGDLVLRQLGAKMKEFFVGQRYPCRPGGEEFAILLPECGVSGGLEAAEEFRQTLSEMKINYHGETLPTVTVSSGIAAFP